ncbi:hypothetical protein NDU88_003878 [Pleurodeles waltl]|uniref:Uncharacterized protein n=1 Tax=Pleurodeles waltl TaxID=8319 RepID=A0AAV7LJR3_PLEWA|nr:hypothetical protein NDU88_003878 [Pleurodeles waltl]
MDNSAFWCIHEFLVAERVNCGTQGTQFRQAWRSPRAAGSRLKRLHVYSVANDEKLDLHDIQQSTGLYGNAQETYYSSVKSLMAFQKYIALRGC